MTTKAEYIVGADLADLTITWQDTDGTALDLSTGYTFSLKVGQKGSAALFTKTTGITGTSTGVTVAWATTGELNTLAAGTHTGQITATRTSDSEQRIQHFTLAIADAIT